MKKWGEIVGCVIIRNGNTQKSHGFGFVTDKQDHLIDFVQNAGPYKIDSREVLAKGSIPRDDSSIPKTQMTVQKLFVGSKK